MSYERQTWSTGETITANKLNHMEDGIAGGGSGGVLVVHKVYDETTDEVTLDKTYSEIRNAPFVVCKNSPEDIDPETQELYPLILSGTGVEDGKYFVTFQDDLYRYYADTENDYPVASLGGGEIIG